MAVTSVRASTNGALRAAEANVDDIIPTMLPAERQRALDRVGKQYVVAQPDKPARTGVRAPEAQRRAGRRSSTRRTRTRTSTRSSTYSTSLFATLRRADCSRATEPLRQSVPAQMWPGHVSIYTWNHAVGRAVGSPSANVGPCPVPPQSLDMPPGAAGSSCAGWARRGITPCMTRGTHARHGACAMRGRRTARPHHASHACYSSRS